LLQHSALPRDCNSLPQLLQHSAVPRNCNSWLHLLQQSAVIRESHVIVKTFTTVRSS